MSTPDVRMKGFGRRASVAEAWSAIDRRVNVLGLERVPFSAALGRILGADVKSDRNVPPHPKSAMDGYAVRSVDLPGTLLIVGEIMAAGRHPLPVKEREAVRIMTGAHLPEGADTVVMVEHTKLDGDHVRVDLTQPPGTHVLKMGEDLAAGAVVLFAGRRLRPQDISLLVTLGVLEVSVRRRPVVRIIPSGSELVPAGTRDPGERVVESNSFMLAALAARDGAEVVVHPLVPDDRELLARALRAPGADLVVVTGGSSVGQEDLAPIILKELGELLIHGIDVKPASPTGIGFLESGPALLAPGFPVASYVAWDLFGRRIVARMLGREADWPYQKIGARLSAPHRKPDGRMEIQRVVLDRLGERLEAKLLLGGAALLSTTTRADGFIVFEPGQSDWEKGDLVEVFLYGS